MPASPGADPPPPDELEPPLAPLEDPPLVLEPPQAATMAMPSGTANREMLRHMGIIRKRSVAETSPGLRTRARLTRVYFVLPMHQLRPRRRNPTLRDWASRESPGRGRVEGAQSTGQEHRERGALAGRAGSANAPTELPNDPVARGQAEPGSLTGGFGGEERLEEVRLGVFGQSGTRVLHVQLEPFAGSTIALLALGELQRAGHHRER